MKSPTARRWSPLRGAVLRTLTLVFALGTLLAPRAALADVQAAYQKEFAFLEAEKVSLQKRLGALQAETEQKKVDAQAELDQLQGRILGLAAHADRMTEALSDVDRELDTAGDGEDLLDSVVAQATTALEKGGVQMPAAATEGDGRAAQIRFAIDNAVRLLGRYSTVLEEPGEFFAAAGEKVSGRIVRVGRIASYGVSADVAGALAPAGEDRLKLWPQGDTAAVARAIANGQSPPTFGMFLHESLDRDVELKQEKTVVEVIESGGVIGWVIVGAGVLAALMALARALLLLRAAANTNRLAERITPALEEKQFDRAIEICKKAKSAGGRVLVATLSHLGRDRVELEDIISEAILHEQPALDRFGSSIIVVAAVAPLLGLLGTVTGMIATFDIITEFGTGNPKLLSGGISIALVTTELGLIVAIPTLIVGNLLSAWAEGIKDGMDKAALRVVNISTGIRLSQRPVAAPGTDTDSANSNRPLAVV